MFSKIMRWPIMATEGGDGGSGGGGSAGDPGSGGGDGGDGGLDLGGLAGAAPAGADDLGSGEGSPAGHKNAGNTGEFAALLEGLDPASVPEKYLKDGKLNTPALLKAATDLEKQVRSGNKAPKKSSDYQIEVPAELSHLVKTTKDAEGNDVEDPLISGFREFAHGKNLPQEVVNDTVNWFLAQAAEMNPELGKPPIDEKEWFKQEMQKLGPDGPRAFQGFTQQVGRWVQLGVLSREEAKSFTSGIHNAEVFSAFSKVLQHHGAAGVPTNLDTGDGRVISKQQLLNMRNATVEDGPQKGRRKIDVDPDYREQVSAAYERFHGTAPAGSTSVPQ